MQSVIVDIPQNVLFNLLELETAEIPDESFPEFVNEAVGNCLTVIQWVRLLLQDKGLDADTYFKAKLFASQIDALNPFREDRCQMRVYFSGELRKNLMEYTRMKSINDENGYRMAYRNPRIPINNIENMWVEDLLRVFADAIGGKTVYGFSDESLLNMNIARQRIGLPPLEEAR